jgi:predicted ATP-grasp superfamily ATP-dependent carboligase
LESHKKITGAIVIEGHVQGLFLTRTLGEKGIPVYVVDKRNCIARYSKYSRKFFICPDYNEDAFADFLYELAKKEKLEGWILLPSNDHAVITLSRNKQKLEEYYKMLVPEFERIEQIYNKVSLLKTASELGVPVPVTHCYTDTITDGLRLKFPVITRGKHGLAFYGALKKKAFIAYSEEELKNQLEAIQQNYSLEDTFTQTVIPFDGGNKTISFTAFSVNGEIKTYWMGVKLREHPVQFGTATFAESIMEPTLLDLSSKLIKHFKYSGVCEIEFLKDPSDNQFKLIEINARTWLWVGLAKACGVDYGLYIYNYLNGITNSYPNEFKVGVKWTNSLTDTVYSLFAFKKGMLTIKNYLKSMKGERVGALYYKGDAKPMFAYALMMFSFLKKR